MLVLRKTSAKLPPVERWTENPVCSVDVFVQESAICDDETAEALKLLGAVGGPPVDGGVATTLTLSKVAVHNVPSLWLVTARPI